MRQRSRWKILLHVIFIAHLSYGDEEDILLQRRNAQKLLYSPRMDYNQWKPLGRGDPLKNDPTFDYVPPVLDRVQYWIDPNKNRKHDSLTTVSGEKSHEILLLGVASNKPAITSLSNDQHQNFNDRNDNIHSKYPLNSPQERISQPNYLTSMTSSLMSLANSLFSSKIPSDIQTPYTVLKPPPRYSFIKSDLNRYQTSPMTQKPPFNPSQRLTTFLPFNNKHAGIAVQESNLIYQATSLSSNKEYESVPSINWELTSSASSATENNNKQLQLPNSFKKFQHSSTQNYSNRVLEVSDSNQNINYVTPPPLVKFKGVVSDDNDISDSFVKIEKPIAQMMDHHQIMMVKVNNVHPIMNQYSTLVNMQTIREMETLKPPPVTQKNPISKLLEKDVSLIYSTLATPLTNSALITEETTTLLPTSSSPALTTTMNTLTTDPLFKHYKQPVLSLNGGPLYLIIQGHSKVKTYKPENQLLEGQETNEIQNYQIIDHRIKHLHNTDKKTENIAKKQRRARTGNLDTLMQMVQTGVGSIDFEKIKENFEEKQSSDGDVNETELESSYKVMDGTYFTTEKYLKGFVEEVVKN